ncbi:hypothetical protein R1sor_005599 [Riccia sorocarpa]|uniref:Coiled-coil domain-containing protein 130 n=1 Tax=Riccia sorocarpa TaxID=122646 RepID=A0ABD3HKN2_9MARC
MIRFTSGENNISRHTMFGSDLVCCQCPLQSTLAAARADNFYYPPEWTPDQGGLNKFHGQHALRERAKKIDQGILVIRFEMPFNIWCGGCQSMIAKGVRFNAEKKAVGNYYSTKIWSFKMKAPCCKQEIEIQTDPKNCEYLVISGAVKKTEDYDEVDAETTLLPEQGDREKLVDPMYKLEHMGADIQKGKEQEPLLVRLQRDADLKHADDYARNKALRAQLRSQKKRVADEEADAKKRGLGIRLLPASQEDFEAASRVKFAQKFDRNRRNRRAEIKASSIFSSSSTGLSERRKVSSTAVKDGKVQLLLKRRKLNVLGVRDLTIGKLRLSSKSGSEKTSGNDQKSSIRILQSS